MRSPNPSNANNVRNVNTAGSLNNNNANNSNGVVPDCESKQWSVQVGLPKAVPFRKERLSRLERENITDDAGSIRAVPAVNVRKD